MARLNAYLRIGHLLFTSFHQAISIARALLTYTRSFLEIYHLIDIVDIPVHIYAKLIGSHILDSVLEDFLDGFNGVEKFLYRLLISQIPS